MLTDDGIEEAMPCFSGDGRYLYYAAYQDGIGSICRMDLQTRKTEIVFHEDGVNAYYPIVKGNLLYFTKWFDAENRCDQLMCCDGEALYTLGCNSDQYDCSDACPLDNGALLYSSTANGAYDLYLFDGVTPVRLPDLSTAGNDLGADFFSWEAAHPEHETRVGDVNADGRLDTADVILLQKWLLGCPGTVLSDPKAAELYADGRTDVFDLAMLKRLLLKEHA